jgi:poly(3-hydroxybutyrate) depolymerase
VLTVTACGSSGGGTESADAATDSSIDAAAAGGSRCTLTGAMLSCSSQPMELGGRTVTFQHPLGTAPSAGWPTVIFYQGSFIAGSKAFVASTGASFGQFELTSTVKALLDRGYAVLAPNAQNNGNLYWQSNVPPYSTNWTGCDDDVFVDALLAATQDGTFGPLDTARRYAMGISSGGFMTSRMAVSYAGKFRALVIEAGSYATCGQTCTVPALPTDHPPTLFMHGDGDVTVPVSAMTPYRDKLLADGRVVDTIIHAGAGHEWLPEGKTAVPDWFDAH